jgi:hypothetical protein
MFKALQSCRASKTCQTFQELTSKLFKTLQSTSKPSSKHFK